MRSGMSMEQSFSFLSLSVRSPQSPETWRSMNGSGFCPVRAKAASAAGVETRWPSGKSAEGNKTSYSVVEVHGKRHRLGMPRRGVRFMRSAGCTSGKDLRGSMFQVREQGHQERRRAEAE